MQLNEAGDMAKATWEEVPERFPSIRLDAFVVMPNHVHGILLVGAQFIAPSDSFEMGAPNQGAINRAPTLGEIVRSYKAASARLLRRSTTPDFAWQPNYYEHVIRDEESLIRIREFPRVYTEQSCFLGNGSRESCGNGG
jgi:REP element-mobilizing transposase RayT